MSPRADAIEMNNNLIFRRMLQGTLLYIVLIILVSLTSLFFLNAFCFSPSRFVCQLQDTLYPVGCLIQRLLWIIIHEGMDRFFRYFSGSTKLNQLCIY